MSLDAMRWAWEQDCRPSAKLVLLALGDCVNGHGLEVWPSQPRLAQRSGLDLKTVRACIRMLVEAGLILDTGRRRGLGGTPVFQLAIPPGWASAVPPPLPQSELELGEPDDGSPTENGGTSAEEPSGSPTKNGMTSDSSAAGSPTSFGMTSEPDSLGITRAPAQNLSESPTESGMTSVHQFGEVLPKTDGGINVVLEVVAKQAGESTQRKRSSPRSPAAPALPAELVEDLPPELLRDFLAMRKDKRAGPLTPTALKGLRREAEKLQLTLAEAVAMCCERSWVSLRASWPSAREEAGGRVAARFGRAPERHLSATERRMETIRGLTNPGPSAAAVRHGRTTDDERTIDVFATELPDKG